MLRLGDRTVALATDCSAELSLELFDAKTKDDIGANDVPGDISGTLSTDALLGINEGKKQQTFDSLTNLFFAKQEISFEVFLAANAMDALQGEDWTNGPMKSKGFSRLIGKALITSLRISGKVTGMATYSAQMKIQGEVAEAEQTTLTASVDEGTLLLDGDVEVVNNVLNLNDYNLVVDDDTLKF